MDITQFFLLFGAIQSLFIALILLWKKRHRKANIFLSILLVLISFQTYLLSMDRLYETLGCALVNMFSRLVFYLYGPLIFFYVTSLIEKDFKWTIKKTLHFIPFVFFGIISTISYLTWEKENSIEWIHYIANTHFLLPVVYETIRFLYLATYIGLGFKKLSHHQKRGKQFFSNQENFKVLWLYQFLTSTLILGVIIAIGLRVNYFGGNPHANAFQQLFFILPIFTYWITYKAITQPDIFSELYLLTNNGNKVSESEKSKYYRSGLSPEAANAIKEELNQLMISQKPFLYPNLKLVDLANQLNISPNHLSQVLNEYLDQNFYEYVNHFRIEAAKINLLEPKFQHYTIEAIAMESGFNSKSHFNKLFKQQVGRTPGHWRKLNQQGPMNLSTPKG